MARMGRPMLPEGSSMNKSWLEPVNSSLSRAEYLQRNDAYHFFAQVGGLLKTGPTQTNVCDLRVITVARQAGIR